MIRHIIRCCYSIMSLGRDSVQEARRKGLLRPGYLNLSHLVIQKRKSLIHFPAAAVEFHSVLDIYSRSRPPGSSFSDRQSNTGTWLGLRPRSSLPDQGPRGNTSPCQSTRSDARASADKPEGEIGWSEIVRVPFYKAAFTTHSTVYTSISPSAKINGYVEDCEEREYVEENEERDWPRSGSGWVQKSQLRFIFG